MSKLTFISTFCILIVGATSMAVDQADQLRVNVKVNVGPKSRVAEDNLLAFRNQKFESDPLKKGFPVSSDILQLIQEGEKKQKEILNGFDQNVHN